MLLMFLLLVFVSQHASGVEVEVEEGEESVLLPCQVPAGVSSDSAAAVWDREELKASIVHVRLQRGDDFKEQNIRYTNRTSMRADALQTGDLSLTLRNPTVSDSGTYTCITRRGGEDQSKTEVQLKVKERLPPPVWPTVILALLCPLVPLVIVFGLFVCLAHKKKKKSKALQPEVVAVPQGVTSVLLPFKTTAVLPQDITVEWRHDNMKVHLYESGNNQPDKQDQEYIGRTETNEDPLRTKDLSLTLKDLHLTDSGFYTCTVYNKDGHVLLQKVVSLSVRALQPEVVEVTQGDKSVLLPFKTRASLPNGIIVEWRLTEPKHMKVHVYESGKDQPDNQDQDYKGRTEMNKDPLNTKDLSVTFKNPRFTDSGVYTCTVYNKDGHMLLQKVVTLSVRVPQQEVVAVTKSVLLPFQTTPDLPQDVRVEWTLTEPKHMKVHVYESGKDQPDKQDQDYRGRTEMKVELLKNGDFSLTLKELQLTDSGVYTYTVYNKDGEELLQKSVILSVKDDGMELVVAQGLKFVLLPFKIPHDLPQGTTVEWRHNYVTVYKYTDVNVDSQHQDFRGRTEMNENPLIKKDLSLTLKDLHLTDSGVYTCIVHKDGHMLLQKVVTVRVRESQPEMVEVKQGLRSVLLPFQTTSVLSQDVTVEWRLIEPRYMVVHVYESGKHHPKKQNQVYRGRTEMNKEPLENGDLSLTLKDLHLTDSGVYTCTVCNKDGHMLLQKSLILSVRATLKGAMADMLPRLRRRRAPEELGNRNQEQEPLNAEERV